VGNYKLAEFITNQRASSVFRATNYTDNVPKAPVNVSALDYSHPSPEYWIDVPLEEKVTAEDVKVIRGINSKEGNAGHGSTSSTQTLDPNHEWYFGPVQVCVLPADIVPT
jgi:hypothetical protein